MAVVKRHKRKGAAGRRKRKTGGSVTEGKLKKRFMKSIKARGIPEPVGRRMFAHYKRRGAGFWSDLGNLGKRVFHGVKKGVKWAAEKGVPMALKYGNIASAGLNTANEFMKQFDEKPKEAAPPAYDGPSTILPDDLATKGGGLRGRKRRVGRPKKGRGLFMAGRGMMMAGR